MINVRQVAWMLYQHFKISDHDSTMLDWDAIISVELKGDNLQQFLNDWEATLLDIAKVPDDEMLESLFRKQLNKSEQLKTTMQLYWQDYTQRKELNHTKN